MSQYPVNRKRNTHCKLQVHAHQTPPFLLEEGDGKFYKHDNTAVRGVLVEEADELVLMINTLDNCDWAGTIVHHMVTHTTQQQPTEEKSMHH